MSVFMPSSAVELRGRSPFKSRTLQQIGNRPDQIDREAHPPAKQPGEKRQQNQDDRYQARDQANNWFMQLSQSLDDVDQESDQKRRGQQRATQNKCHPERFG